MSTPPNNPNSGFSHLHYGGSQNPKTSRLGPKPQAGRLFKAQKRLETIVRLENAGIGEGASAAMLGISVPRLRYLKKSPEYLSARIQITHGIIIDTDQKLEQIKQQRKEILTQMLPPALQVIANELMRPAASLPERRHQATIALELLDREGTFAKVSRTEIKPVEHFDFEQADAESAKAIAAIRGIAAPPRLPVESESPSIEATNSMHSLEAVEANEAFSNSHTLSATDQEKALAKLEEEARLLDINLEGKPVN